VVSRSDHSGRLLDWGCTTGTCRTPRVLRPVIQEANQRRLLQLLQPRVGRGSRRAWRRQIAAATKAKPQQAAEHLPNCRQQPHPAVPAAEGGAVRPGQPEGSPWRHIGSAPLCLNMVSQRQGLRKAVRMGGSVGQRGKGREPVIGPGDGHLPDRISCAPGQEEQLRVEEPAAAPYPRQQRRHCR
jgi:hypothetical protein